MARKRIDGSEHGLSEERIDLAVENLRKHNIEHKGAKPLSMVVPELPWKKNKKGDRRDDSKLEGDQGKGS